MMVYWSTDGAVYLKVSIMIMGTSINNGGYTPSGNSAEVSLHIRRPHPMSTLADPTRMSFATLERCFNSRNIIPESSVLAVVL